MRRAALAGALALVAAPAAAHPLGNFTVNRYAALDVRPGRLAVHYVVDMAEIPAFQELRAADGDGDGALGAAERAAWAARTAAAIRDGLVATLAGAPLALVPGAHAVALPPGAGGLPTLRLDLDLEAALPAATGRVTFRDGNFAGRAGWREVVARAGGGLALARSSVPAHDRSDALRAYPTDLLATPPAVSAAHFEVVAAPAGAAAGEAPDAVPAAGARAGAMRFADRLTELVATRAPLGPRLLLLSLLAAAGLGALHALGPGHGKAIVGAYLVGARGTARHACLLGLVVTLTHTLGVYVLGLATLGASRWVLPERLFPWLGAASGLLVLAIGASLLVARLGAVADGGPAHGPDGHEHDHTHGPGGHHHHHHGHGHHHVPGGPLGWRALLALGVSGGLLPCPSAMVVMLGAIGLGRVAFGLCLIVAFSAGLAAVLVAVGLAFVHARRLLDRVPSGGRLLRAAPVVSALAISLAGLVIVMQALRGLGA
ncbi:MAG TPA: high-affinity nickel-transporter [Candidatus Binatia bacterium]|nr:high-affinity nickel-transporter [Candidatus Binatia bacterium]